MARSSDARSHYEDHPTRAPMAPKGSGRQSLTSDEKKMKRRSAAVNPDGVQAMTRAKRNRLEAMLRQRMASSSLQDQKAAARALDRLRAEANAEVEASQGLDYSERVVSSRLTPVQVANHHTAATDWLADEGTQVDGSEVQRAMHAQASRWFTRTSEAVRAEPDEFVIQAQGMARKLAGAHAPMQAVAADAFVRHAMFLNRSNLPTRGKTAATFGDVADGYITLWNPTEGSETDKGAYWWEAFAPDANINMDRPVASGYADSAEQAEQAAEDAASEHHASAPWASHSSKTASSEAYQAGLDIGTEYAGTDPSEFAYPSVLTETVMESGMDPNAMSAGERNDWMRGFREGLGATASRVTAGLDALDQAILEHAQSATGTIQVGDLIDGHRITEVGTHTIQHERDGWNGSRQVPFVGPHGEMYPSHQRATAESSRRTAADEHPWVDPEYERQVLKAVGELATGSPTASQVVAWLSNAFYLAGGYQDSFDRERAFSLAAQATGFDYNAIYDAWLDNPGFGDRWTYIQPKVWGGRSKTSSRRTAADDRVVFDDYFSGVLGDMDGKWAWQLTEGPDQGYGYAPTEAQARADMQAVVDNFWASHPIRTAVVESSDATVAQVQNYLPSNYKAKERGGQVVIEGFDSAGWTLEDYVIPRLQSGLIMARVASRKTASHQWETVDRDYWRLNLDDGWVATVEARSGGFLYKLNEHGRVVESGAPALLEDAMAEAERAFLHHSSRKSATRTTRRP